MSDTPLRPEDAPPSLYDDQGNPRFFTDPGMDRFVAVVMNLAQEVWVQEERLLALQARKAALAEGVLGQDAAFAPKFGEDDLRGLLAPLR